MDLKRHHLNRNGEIRKNNHHFFFEAAKYRGNFVLNALRNHEASQRLYLMPNHESLHRDIGGLAMRLIMARISLEFLDTQPKIITNEDKIFNLSEYYWQISRSPSFLNRDAGMHHEHLEAQFQYLGDKVI